MDHAVRVNVAVKDPAWKGGVFYNIFDAYPVDSERPHSGLGGTVRALPKSQLCASESTG